MTLHIGDLDQAVLALQAGHVLAYPTEAVYGLGCDAFNQTAVERILTLKGRLPQQGVIVLIADWPQLFPLIGEVPADRLMLVKETWPGPVTWVFPKSENIPQWISGAHPSIAIRMTAHPIAQKLCQLGPIISTSANLSGHAPARSIEQVEQFFPEGLDGIVLGALGTESKPTAMYDALTQQQLR